MKKIDQELINAFSMYYPDPLLALFTVIGIRSVDNDSKDARINAGLVLGKGSIDEIRQLKKCVSSLIKNGVTFPYVFTNEFIEASLDSFPLEFLELQLRHRMVLGTSPFSARTPDVRHVRLQCEREIKGRILHLKAALLGMPKPSQLREVMLLSLRDIERIAIGLLVLKGVTLPSESVDIFLTMAKLYNLDSELLSKLGAGEVRLGETDMVFDKYIVMLETLSGVIE